MTNNDEIIIENTFNEFLKQASEIAHGDTAKEIKITDIWRDSSLKSVSHDIYSPKIVQLLKDNGFIIKDDSSNDEIRVTYDGIYYIIDKFGIPAENLGVLSYNDLNQYLNPFLEVLYSETKGDSSRSVNIYEIQKKRLRALSKGPMRQISEFLKMKGLVEEGESKDTVKIPSRKIKKPYEAPLKK